MKWIVRIVASILWLLNLWFFKLPSRLTVIAFCGYYLAIELIIGDQPTYLFNRDLEAIGFGLYYLFWIGLGFPFFWSFVSMFAGSENLPGMADNSLKEAIRFRDGQMSISTPQKAFEIQKKTAVLDVLNENSNSHIHRKAMEGFRALHGDEPPQKTYKSLIEKD
jgi:hypothetical protein